MLLVQPVIQYYANVGGRASRATRCESGSVQEAAIWGDRSILTDDKCSQLSLKAQTEIWALYNAEK
jgi:hypothetical protein